MNSRHRRRFQNTQACERNGAFLIKVMSQQKQPCHDHTTQQTPATKLKNLNQRWKCGKAEGRAWLADGREVSCVKSTPGEL